MTERRCGQILGQPPHQCSEVGAYVFYWPGSGESFICHKHVQKLREVAAALGLDLVIQPLGRKESVDS